MAFYVAGAAIAGAGPSPKSARGALAVLFFHAGVYIANDAVDALLDRTEARRARDLVASGEVSSKSAGLMSGGMISAGTLVALANGVLAAGTYLLAVICLMAYNFFGKCCPFPPVMDVIQGFGWGGLTVLGAENARFEPWPTVLMTLGVVVYITLINGFHGALRDYRNDSAHHVRTTATFFLGEASAKRRTEPTPIYIAYGLMLHAAQAVLVISAVMLAGQAIPRAVIVAAALTELVTMSLFSVAVLRFAENDRTWRLGIADVVLGPAAMLMVVWIRSGLLIYCVILIFYTTIWAFSKTLRSQVRRMIARGA
ncbi:UbiA family prenyltransferase [Actinoallomurus sp. CA-142502]|uniref:UbiA family prenyltransferase n=1 Tax=Actinoallomurus sp. CA-142502 TaxID=3239885 RepID=UPI003D8D42D1